ncbi:MAG: IPT/TIG domain-containing protein [Planctomycetota bacterium]
MRPALMALAALFSFAHAGCAPIVLGVVLGTSGGGGGGGGGASSSAPAPSAPAVPFVLDPAEAGAVGGAAVKVKLLASGPYAFTAPLTVSLDGKSPLSVSQPDAYTLELVVPAASNEERDVPVVVDAPGFTLRGTLHYRAYAPQLSSAAPAQAAAGAFVTLTGQGFVAGCQVYVSGTPASGVEVLSSTQLRFVAPSGPSGTVNVRVQHPAGLQAELAKAFSYPPAPAPAPPATPLLKFQTVPATASAGALPTVEVAFTDGGVLYPSATGNVTLKLQGNDGSVTLGGTLTRALVNGVATFNDLSLSKPGAYYRLQARKDSGEVATASLKVTPGAANRVVFVGAPSTPRKGVALAPRVEVAVADAQGNIVRGSTATVTVSLDANAAGAALSGTKNRAAVDGVAHFDDLSIDKAATSLTLRASSAGLADGTLALDVSPPPLRILSARMSDGPTAGTGYDGDDQVLIIFDQATQKPTLDATNINQALGLNIYPFWLGNAIQSWLSGGGQLGGAVWNAAGDQLTITLSTTGGNPSVTGNSWITRCDATIKSASGAPLSSDPVRLRGAADALPKIYEVHSYVVASGFEFVLYGANFDPAPGPNTASVSVTNATGETIVTRTNDEVRVRVTGVSGVPQVSLTINGVSSNGFSLLMTPYQVCSSIKPVKSVALTLNTPGVPTAPRFIATDDAGLYLTVLDNLGAVWSWTRLGDTYKQAAPNGSAASVAAGELGWLAFGTNAVPTGGLRAQAIYVTHRLDGPLTLNPDKELASLDGAGTPLTAACRDPSISEDARYVTFECDQAPPGIEAISSGPFVLLRDRTTAKTTLLSRDEAGNAVTGTSPRLSRDGRLVSFLSPLDLTSDDSNGKVDAYLLDRTTGRLYRISPDAGGVDVGSRAELSQDGRIVAYARNNDLYLYDRQLSAPAVAVSNAGEPSLSRDGKRVAFTTTRADLGVTDTNGVSDVYVLDRPSATYRGASISNSGATLGSPSDHPTISGDGSFVYHRYRVSSLQHILDMTEPWWP